MTTGTRPYEPTLAALRARRDSARTTPRSVRRPQLIADAVVANYIHTISVRHRRRGQPAEPTGAAA